MTDETRLESSSLKHSERFAGQFVRPLTLDARCEERAGLELVYRRHPEIRRRTRDKKPFQGRAWPSRRTLNECYCNEFMIWHFRRIGGGPCRVNRRFGRPASSPPRCVDSAGVPPLTRAAIVVGITGRRMTLLSRYPQEAVPVQVKSAWSVLFRPIV